VNSHPLSVMGSTLVVFCKMCMSQMAGLSHYCERDHQRTGTGDDCRQEYWKRRHKLNWTGRSNNHISINLYGDLKSSTNHLILLIRFVNFCVTLFICIEKNHNKCSKCPPFALICTSISIPSDGSSSLSTIFPIHKIHTYLHTPR
jgi:hypothetical protein